MKPEIGDHQTVAVLGGHLDMVSQYRIVLDLEARDAGGFAIAGLERGDRAARIARGRAQRVERGVIPLGNEAAVLAFGRRTGHQRAGQRIDQRAMAVERGQQRIEQRGAVGGQREPFAQQARAAEAIADRAEIAGRPARCGDAAERARDVGKRPQRIAQGDAQAFVVVKPLHQRQPVVDRGAVHQWRRQVGGEQPRARAGDAAVDTGKQAAGAATRLAARDLEAFARRRVDQHVRRAPPLDRRAQQRQGAAPGVVKIGDKAAHSGAFGAAEIAEPVERRDAEHAP